MQWIINDLKRDSWWKFSLQYWTAFYLCWGNVAKQSSKLNTQYSFLQNLHDLTPAQIQESADRLVEANPQDLEDKLKDELPQFSELV